VKVIRHILKKKSAIIYLPNQRIRAMIAMTGQLMTGVCDDLRSINGGLVAPANIAGKGYCDS
jgi:hypothetical protein